MIVFGNLHIEGFCSIANFEINLNQNGITLIKGVNGVGKSNMLGALTWALYGVNLKGTSEVNTWKSYRDKDYKGTLVSIYFSNNGKQYKVTRCQNYKDKIEGALGQNRLLFYKDAILSDEKKKAEIEKQILEAIGLSYNLFIASILFGQGLKRLIQETNADKKDLFEEIFQLSYISEARDLAKQQYLKIDNLLTKQINAQNDILTSLEVINSSLKKAKQEKENFLLDKKNQLKELKESKKLVANELRALTSKGINYDEDNLIKVQEELKSIKANELKLQEANDINLEDLIEEILELLLQGKIKACIKKVKTLKTNFNNLEITRKYKADTLAKLSELKELKYKHDLWVREVEHAESKLSNLKSRLEKVKELKPSTLSNDFLEKQEIYESQLSEIEPIIENYQKQLRIYKWCYTEPLGNNGLKAFLFDSSLDELNQILKSYTDSIGISIQFIIDTSTVRKDFETMIEIDRNLVFYAELSGGQKQLVNLAMAFAMNTLVTNSKDINILFLDEIFESLSYDNIELVIALIKKAYKDKTLFLITHQESLPLNARTIRVSKEKGLSAYNY